MVALFLRTELASARFGDGIRALLERDGLPRRVVTAPNLDGETDNQARLRLLTGHRGYGTRTELFEGFPADVCWQRMTMTAAELAQARFIDHDYWVVLSGGTRLAVDAAVRVPAGAAPFGVPQRRLAGPGPGGRCRGPGPAADSGHHQARRRPGGAGGPHPADRFHAGP